MKKIIIDLIHNLGKNFKWKLWKKFMVKKEPICVNLIFEVDVKI